MDDAYCNYPNRNDFPSRCAAAVFEKLGAIVRRVGFAAPYRELSVSLFPPAIAPQATPTPPGLLCNREIKVFGGLCPGLLPFWVPSWIATGHYARLSARRSGRNSASRRHVQ